MNKAIPFTVLLATLINLPAIAANQATQTDAVMEHAKMGDSDRLDRETSDGATGQGVINAVDAEKGVVNINHGPIPALSWPDMTMDLPVTEGVDLHSLQPGDAVRFRVVLGADQVYRITAMEVTH